MALSSLIHVIGWTAHTYGIWVHGNNAIDSVQEHYLYADNFITHTTIQVVAGLYRRYQNKIYEV